MSLSTKVAGLLLLQLTLIPTALYATKSTVRIECVAGCAQGALGALATQAKLLEPFGVAFDRRGNWYICEHNGQRITKVDSSGIISLFAGSAGPGDRTAGSSPLDLKFHDPHGLVISRDDQMYVADTLNNRVIRIDLKTGGSSVIAGTGQAGYSGDGGPAIKATFAGLFALALNRAGDRLFLTDLGNHRIRVVDLKSGIVTTIAGNGETGVPLDGHEATRSPLVDPRAVVLDSKGLVYILERKGNALRVIDRNGRIRTPMGPGVAILPTGAGGGRIRDLNGPKHLCVDGEDNVIIADTENHLVRRYRPSDGTTAVVAGSGEAGSAIVQDDPLKTQLNRPHGVSMHSSGVLYIADSENHRVLKLGAAKQ